jgi:hypothetical protein
MAERNAIQTLSNALPDSILFLLAKTGHAFRIAPPNEVRFFELTHIRLLTGFHIRGHKEAVVWRRSEMERQFERC